MKKTMLTRLTKLARMEEQWQAQCVQEAFRHAQSCAENAMQASKSMEVGDHMGSLDTSAFHQKHQTLRDATLKSQQKFEYEKKIWKDKKIKTHQYQKLKNGK